MNNKRPGDNKPNDGDKKKGPSKRPHWLVGSQFAYTLVAATLIMGFIGNWLGKLLGGPPWTFILMFLLGGAGFAAEVYRMIKMFSPKDGDDDGDDSDGDAGKLGGTSGSTGTTFGGTRSSDRLPDGPEGDIERPGDDDRRGGDDIERPGDDDRRGGDDIERPGEADDRPFVGGPPFGGLPGDGLSREELDEIIREIEGLTPEELDEINKAIGGKPDGSPLDDETIKPEGDAKDKNNKGSNE